MILTRTGVYDEQAAFHAFHMQSRDRCQPLTAFGDQAAVGYGDIYASGRIGGYGNVQQQAVSLLLPMAAQKAVTRLEVGRRGGQSAAGVGKDAAMAVAGAVLIGVDACNDAVQPIPDSAVGVMVERIHAGRFEGAIRPDAVPTFPDGGCAHFY